MYSSHTFGWLFVQVGGQSYTTQGAGFLLIAEFAQKALAQKHSKSTCLLPLRVHCEGATSTGGDSYERSFSSIL